MSVEVANLCAPAVGAERIVPLSFGQCRLWFVENAGSGAGFAACPGCANEGAGYKYVGPGVAAGAAIGALGFLSSPYRTIYNNK